MIFARWRARRAARALIDHLHGEIVASARNPALYVACGVPDTMDGRFEMLVLHADMLLRRLTMAGEGEIAADLMDRLFEGLDDGLREQAIGDAGVVRRMSKFAGAYFGRAAAYGRALEEGDEPTLAVALARNVFLASEGAPARALAARALATFALLKAAPNASLGNIRFRYPVPETAS